MALNTFLDTCIQFQVLPSFNTHSFNMHGNLFSPTNQLRACFPFARTRMRLQAIACEPSKPTNKHKCARAQLTVIAKRPRERSSDCLSSDCL